MNEKNPSHPFSQPYFRNSKRTLVPTRQLNRKVVGAGIIGQERHLEMLHNWQVVCEVVRLIEVYNHLEAGEGGINGEVEIKGGILVISNFSK
jgi:hypothetical protein